MRLFPIKNCPNQRIGPNKEVVRLTLSIENYFCKYPHLQQQQQRNTLEVIYL